MGRGATWSVLLFVALLSCATPGALAKEVRLSESVYLEGPFLVSPEDTLIVGPGTVVTGPGRIDAWGSLRIEGDPDAPVELTVPVRLMGNGTSRFEHARFWGVNATAVHVTAGGLVAENVTFEANGRGLHVEKNATLDLDAARLRAHDGEAMYVQDQARVNVTRTHFTDNGRGATVFSAADLLVVDSTFSDNGQHLVIDLGPWSDPAGAFELARNDFGRVRATLASIHVSLEGTQAAIAGNGTPLLSVHLEDNHIHDGEVGLHLEGAGLAVQGRNDTIAHNRIGIRLDDARLRLDHARLGNDLDVDGTGDLALPNVTYLDTAGATIAPGATVVPSTGWDGWAIGALAAIAVLGGALSVQRRRRGAAHPGAHAGAADAAEPEPPAHEPPAEPAPIHLKPQERRVLEDVAAHPGTPQRACADRLGMTRQALHYHVKKLEARGLLAKSVAGRETHCEVTPEGTDALRATDAAPPVTQPRSEENP